MNQYRLSVNQLESRFAEEDLEVPAEKLDVSQQRGQFWAHNYKRDMGRLEQVQQRDTKMIKGSEHLSDKERLIQVRLFSLEERKLMGRKGEKKSY